MKFSFLSAEVEPHIETFFECVLKGGVNGGELSIKCQYLPLWHANGIGSLCRSGSFNASSRRMLMVRFVLDMCSSIVSLACSCNELRAS